MYYVNKIYEVFKEMTKELYVFGKELDEQLLKVILM